MAFVGRWRMMTAFLAMVLAASALVLMPEASLAVPDASGVVIDDFEDGDSSDWGFFGGNLAGGGGGIGTDRPYEGSFYLSTGWGGEGTTSGFYGGAFKSFDNTAQVTPPADSWFNVWVLNQSDATADGYTLEITIREDLDGNGWTDGEEDSFRLDTPFTSSSFDDNWTLVSAPVSSFTDLGTGGDGTFDGDLDEVVIVVAGVTGASGATVEVDFDLFAFSSGGPLASDQVIDDFESGLPFGSAVPNGEPLGFYTFQGDGSVTIAAAATPPAPTLPAVGTPNNVMQMDVDVSSFAGGSARGTERRIIGLRVNRRWAQPRSQGTSSRLHRGEIRQSNPPGEQVHGRTARSSAGSRPVAAGGPGAEDNVKQPAGVGMVAGMGR